MPNLPKLTPTLKTGQELLTSQSQPTTNTLLDFWRWSVSDLVSNATRGRFAEFIVATALKIDLNSVRSEWDAFDLTSPEGIKIEVKSASYLQSWQQSDYSKISFSIKKARYWDSETNKSASELSRSADAYVFCLLKHKDKLTLDPLNLDQWDFYVLPVATINNYQRSESSITLKSLEKLTAAVGYSKLRETVLARKLT